MKVVFGPCGSRKATVRITVDAGSSVEYGGRWTPGIAHFTEHMIFQGGKDFESTELSREMASLGAEHNAATGNGKVTFFVDAPAENIERAAELMAKTLLDRTFDEDSLEKEKLVVLEEERGSQDDIDNVIHEKLNSFLCKGPYAKPILGTKESIMSMTLEEVQEFYNYYYKPSRMLMTVTGDHLANDTISGFFGGDTNSFKKSERAPNVNLKRKRLVIPTAVKQARVFISYNGFPVKSKHSLPLHFMSKFFSNGVDTRLFEELRQKRGLCYGVGSYVVLEKDIGWYVLSTRTAEENVSQCVKLLDKEVKKLLEDGPTEEEMFRAKNKYISEIYGFIETSYGLNAVLESKFFNNLPSLETSISRIKNMSKGKIMSTCRDVFIKDNRKVFICTPKGDE